tara:strand:- start:7988 stop:9007 length:1020 start_codon:yes stop_codon:yes gene_type:complete
MKTLNNEALDVLVEYYYPRAKWLQDNCNWGKKPYTGQEATKTINDPLMQSIDIYDCSTRNAAGFSNVIQDLKFGVKTPKWHHQDSDRKALIKTYDTKKWDEKTWLYTYMCHRIFGSGASFEHDHGYRNNCVQHWGTLRDWQDMSEDMVERKATGQALFTSIGNQPPAPKKGVSNVDFASKELPILLDRCLDWLHSGKKKTHKEVVDYLNQYNLAEGHRRFNFVYAAFSYDLGDYHKKLVDDKSHGYFGNNAIRCMKMMSSGYTTDEFMDVILDKMGGTARDNEDVLCDFVRFGQNYVPRTNNTFDHVPSTITNNSGWDSGWTQRTGEPRISTTLNDFFT